MVFALRNVRSHVGELSFDFHILQDDDDESSRLMSTVRHEDR